MSRKVENILSKSADIEDGLLKMLNDFNIEYKETHCSEAMANLIVDDIKKRLEDA